MSAAKKPLETRTEGQSIRRKHGLRGQSKSGTLMLCLVMFKDVDSNI
jgi:hypothetical protein